MNKTQLKKLIKPVVKECIQEVLIEEGLLTEVVSQVTAGLAKQPIVENRPKKRNDNLFNEDLQMKRKSREANKKLQEHRRKLLDSIGGDAYNGVDLFEGTTPMKAQATNSVAQGSRALEGVDPRDPGVDLGALGFPVNVWKKLAGS